MLAINMALSVFVTLVNFIGVLKLRQHVFVAASGGMFLFMAANICLMRDCYYDLRDKFRYFVANYLASVAFYVTNIAIGFIFNSTVYAWLFSITKFARFSHLRWSSLISVTLFLGLMFISIHVATIGMNGIFEDDGLFDNVLM